MNRQLVDFNPEHQPRLRDYLRPISHKLLMDLERLYRDAEASDSQLMATASALADFIDDDEIRLAELLLTATPEQYEIVWPRLAKSRHSKLIAFLDDLVRQQPAEGLSPADRVDLGRRRAGAAIIRLRQGAREEILPIFEFAEDPEAMTQFIHRCRRRGVRAEEILELLDTVEKMSPIDLPRDRLTQAQQVSPLVRGPAEVNVQAAVRGYSTRHARYALLMALGEFAAADIPEAKRQPLIEKLSAWYRHDPSSGIRGAAGWLLRQWGCDDLVREVDQTPIPYAQDREWFTRQIAAGPAEGPEKSREHGAKTIYMTFVVIQPGTYTVGSPLDEPERGNDEHLHDVVLTQPIAISDREVTFTEMIACQQSGAVSFDYEGVIPQYGSSPDTALIASDWYDAVHFCRWLTQREGWSEDDQCYPDPATLDPEKFPLDEQSAVPRNWPVRVEGVSGFRLPTEHEWEIACRGDLRVAYAFGGDESWLGQYAWFRSNEGNKSVHVPKTRRPSWRGLFDMHGNISEWCHDWYEAYPSGTPINPMGPPESPTRVLRGGGWLNDAANSRTAVRFYFAPTDRRGTFGFRIALVPSAEKPAD